MAQIDRPDFSYVVIEVRGSDGPLDYCLVEVTAAPARGYRRKGDVALLWLSGRDWGLPSPA